MILNKMTFSKAFYLAFGKCHFSISEPKGLSIHGKKGNSIQIGGVTVCNHCFQKPFLSGVSAWYASPRQAFSFAAPWRSSALYLVLWQASFCYACS